MLTNKPDNDEVFFKLTKEDIQSEAEHYYGRHLNEDEYLRIKKILEFGLGENMLFIYQSAFAELNNN